MTNQRILETAVKKANKNGFGVNDGWLIPSAQKLLFDDEYKKLIFNHDFAKALWGDKNYMAYKFNTTLDRQPENLSESGIYPLWKWHLVRMTTSIDPIKYLGDNI